MSQLMGRERRKVVLKMLFIFITSDDLALDVSK